ncbi:hypothetical protein PHLCEN_2v8339 [Hermanssonia centrifuga]|uniref:RING-type domain-containing protein n=1 Tax=Hermanssonia centrifuga TaxID=98765 RepID=A0A2R6NTV9_9APHY|nr:hypothetical protein PHLCEN_2v8339 [Hermanssonia centrifuga]
MDALSSERQGSAGPSQQHPPQSSPQYQPRTRTTSHPTNTFPRPDLDREHQQQDREPRAEQRPEPQYQQPQPNSRHSNPNSYPNVGSQSNFRNHSYTQMPEPDTRYTGASSTNLNVPPSYNPRPRSSSAPRTPTAQPAPSTRATSPSPSVPSLDELLAMPPENIRALSISHLKAILFRNHVTMGTVVEKSELVAKVERLVEDEKLEREASRRREEEEEAEREEREMAEAIERSRREHEENEMRERARERQANQGGHEEAPSSAPAAETAGNTPMSPKAQAMASHLERTGLCVICQDDEANIAIVDCGHLAMCRNCSDLIMASTKECPLCRTRIITEARLLRIFKS